ncbi:MAG: DnaA regulatory inactivator Hda [Burkholderiales bacterium]|jgi:DnaA family protein|nr:DnaA regulatory inactivator Hda [Burkholderiales bacterium]
MKQIALDIGLAAGPSLRNFLAGPNLAALEHLVLWSGYDKRSPVPTYLWGESGSGKSHLLRAVLGQLQEQASPVGWLDATIAEPPAFQENWRVVLLDDVDLYSAVQQQAAFNWFVNATSPQDGQQRWVLASGNVPPSDLQLREDLRTRLGWGHVFQLQVLSESERRAVLRQNADERGIFLSDEVMDFMLHRFSRDLGNLLQMLDQLDGYALQTQRAITIPLLKSMLENAP